MTPAYVARIQATGGRFLRPFWCALIVLNAVVDNLSKFRAHDRLVRPGPIDPLFSLLGTARRCFGEIRADCVELIHGPELGPNYYGLTDAYDTTASAKTPQGAR